MLPVGLLYVALIMSRYVPSIPHLYMTVTIKGYWMSKTFSISNRILM